MHGGNAPHVKAARQRRVALAEGLAADPRRSPDEVLADVLAQSDYLWRQARAEITAKRPTAATMAKLLELSEGAGRWAKTVLDAEVDQRQTRVAEAQAVLLAGVIRRVLGRLDLTPAQLALVSTVVPEEVQRLAITTGDSG